MPHMQCVKRHLPLKGQRRKANRARWLVPIRYDWFEFLLAFLHILSLLSNGYTEVKLLYSGSALSIGLE